MGIINSPSYADYVAEEEDTEELEVEQPPAATSAPTKKMTVILSASSSKALSKKQPSTATEPKEVIPSQGLPKIPEQSAAQGKDLSNFFFRSFVLHR